MTEKNISSYFPGLPPESLDELNDYNKHLSLLADHSVSIQFTNKGREHAICVMAKIFETARDEVKIFAGSFGGEISDNALYIEKLEHFLQKKDSKLDIIFESSPNYNSKALAAIKKGYRQKVSLKVANTESLANFQTFLAERQMIHFTIANYRDSEFSVYRCETDTKKYQAILNFDDKKFCASLNNLFNVLEKDAVPYVI